MHTWIILGQEYYAHLEEELIVPPLHLEGGLHNSGILDHKRHDLR